MIHHLHGLDGTHDAPQIDSAPSSREAAWAAAAKNLLTPCCACRGLRGEEQAVGGEEPLEIVADHAWLHPHPPARLTNRSGTGKAMGNIPPPGPSPEGSRRIRFVRLLTGGGGGVTSRELVPRVRLPFRPNSVPQTPGCLMISITRISTKAALLAASVFVAFASAGSQAARGETIWNARTDLGTSVANLATATNPNGAWSYGYRATLDGPGLTLMTDKFQDTTVSLTGDGGWRGPFTPGGGFLFPNVIYRASIADALRVNPPVGTAGATPSPANLVIRWTAPSAGTFDLSTTFAYVGNGSGDGIQGYVYRGTTQLFDSGVLSTNPSVSSQSSASFTSPPLALSSGESIDFVVNRGGAGENDQTNFNAVISVPEPSLAALLGSTAAAAGVWFASRRRAKGA